MSSRIEPGFSPSASGFAEAVVYRPVRRKQLRLVLLGALMLAAGVAVVLTAKDDGGRLGGGLATAFFALVWLVLLQSLLRGVPRLALTGEGVVWTGGLRERRIPWASLDAPSWSEVTRRRRMLRLVGRDAAGRRVRCTLAEVYAVPLTTIAAEIEHARAGRAGRVPEDTAPRAFAQPATSAGRPWATWGFLLLLVIVYAVELLVPVEPAGRNATPALRTLLALGAVNRGQVLAGGEWWRLLSGPMLHGSPLHILLNGFVLVLIGGPLERAIGRAWFVAVFLLGAVAGAVGTLLLDQPNLVSVGASGAIMALLACGFAVSFRFAEGSLERRRMQGRALRLLIPSLLPLQTGAAALRVDYAAHAGGAMAGALIGFALLRCWPRGRLVAPGLRLARVLAGLLLLALAGSLAAVAWRFPLHAGVVRLIPTG
jgi:membrane associated rhomboid family serine protease